MTEVGDIPARSGFPIGLTFAVVVVFGICSALGVWQLQRAGWKAQELARIEASRRDGPIQIDTALARFARGEDLSFTRVAADCLPAPAAPAQLHMVPDNGEWIARARSPCRLAERLFGGIVVDRGFVAASRGQPNPATPTLPAPAHVVGVLYSRAEPPALGLTHPAPYTLVVEREFPPAPGVRPTPYPDASGNLEYVGSYAPTWFGLAGVTLCVYAAMLWRRSHPKPSPPR